MAPSDGAAVAAARFAAAACRSLVWAILDPVPGPSIRAARSTERRHKCGRPGRELVHIDVTTVGRTPGDGGWRVNTDQNSFNQTASYHRVDFDGVHAAVRDHPPRP